MPILTDVKTALRRSSNTFDNEISNLINSARLDMVISGITQAKADDDTDALIKQAIILYCKAEFGYDNQESERFKATYIKLKEHLSLCPEYNTEVVP